MRKTADGLLMVDEAQRPPVLRIILWLASALASWTVQLAALTPYLQQRMLYWRPSAVTKAQ
jgi:hypothetical protein